MLMGGLWAKVGPEVAVQQTSETTLAQQRKLRLRPVTLGAFVQEDGQVETLRKLLGKLLDPFAKLLHSQLGLRRIQGDKRTNIQGTDPGMGSGVATEVDARKDHLREPSESRTDILHGP